MKICTECGLERPPEDFAKAGKWQGTQLYKSKCKPCTNEAMRNQRSDAGAIRNHFQNVQEERSPHGKGICKVSVPGWGYAGNVRALPAGKRGRRSGAVPVRDQKAAHVVVPPDNRPDVLEERA